MSPIPTKTKTAPKAPAAKAAATAAHYLQFVLQDHDGTPIQPPRRYTLTYTNEGETTETTKSGTTTADGLTAAITTKGRVNVLLGIAPPEGSECKLIGSLPSRPKKGEPLPVRLAFHAIITSAPKPEDKCETLIIRSGKQRIQYLIDNVDKVGGHENKLLNLPYLIVDVDSGEILSRSPNSVGGPSLMKGDATQVHTDAVDVDGVKTVGLVFGNATDDSGRWKDPLNDLILYQVEPKEEGLTQVFITEIAKSGDDIALKLGENIYKAQLNGKTWAHVARHYTVDDIETLIPGDSAEIVAAHPNEMQIAYAEARKLITDQEAEAYRAARVTKKTVPETPPKAAAPKVAAVPELPPLRFTCSWVELLAPIYDGDIVGKDAEKSSGGGTLLISPLGLTIELSATACGNAVNICKISKQETLRRTHPYTYMMLLDACRESGVTHVRIESTWRPMYGSVLHKLGDAMDLTLVENEDHHAEAFRYGGGKVNTLAQAFGEALYKHRYAVQRALFYIGDAYNPGSPTDKAHNNHLHFTADRLKPLHEQDKAAASETRGPSNWNPDKILE
jgi:hypothetical protein